MNYPCGIIKDILPLYIDDACSEESKAAVETHLSQCPGCKQCYESMKSPENFAEGIYRDAEDAAMEKGLKKVRKTINKRLILCILAAVVLCTTFFYVLFVAPLKDIGLEDISVSATVYPMDQLLKELCQDENTVQIFADEGDSSPVYTLIIPAMPNASISVSEKIMEENEFLTVISFSSPYAIKRNNIQVVGDTMYIKTPKTTLLNNKNASYGQTEMTIGFQEVTRIIHCSEDGTETVLWENTAE